VYTCVRIYVQCKHCGKPFASHAAHDSHVRRTHTKTTSSSAAFTCTICRRSFTHAYELEYHLSSHRGLLTCLFILHPYYVYMPICRESCPHNWNRAYKKGVLSWGKPRDAAVNFDTYRSLQRHRAVFTAIARLFLLKNTKKSRLNHGVKYDYIYYCMFLFIAFTFSIWVTLCELFPGEFEEKNLNNLQRYS